jgi:hypothetical protein
MRPANFTPDQSPLPGITLPFLAAAPWFAVAAGLLLTWQGPAALTSRWSPATLALTHLLTVGFMLQAMWGALLQFACVVGGARIWRAAASARLAQALMLFGGIALPVALGTANGSLLMAGAMPLSGGIAVAVASLLAGLWRSRAGLRAGGLLWPALLALTVTGGLGVLLVGALGGRITILLPQVTDLHAAWGLGGWSLLLLIGVGTIAVPMLHLTVRYPRWIAIGCAALVCGSLLAWSLLVMLPVGLERAAVVAQVAVAVAAGTFAAVMLQLMRRARRPARDASALYWWMALTCMLLAAIARCLMEWVPSLIPAEATLGLGILVLVGVFVAAISGMMYKIVPFMLWLRLMRLHGARRAPGIADIIPARAARGQCLSFACALPLLLIAAFAPPLARAAGAAFCVSSLWLAVNVTRALWVHREAFSALPSREVRHPAPADAQPRG